MCFASVVSHHPSVVRYHLGPDVIKTVVEIGFGGKFLPIFSGTCPEERLK